MLDLATIHELAAEAAQEAAQEGRERLAFPSRLWAVTAPTDGERR